MPGTFWKQVFRQPAQDSCNLHRYENLSHDSGVAQYQLREGAILVQFVDGSIYEYTDASAGKEAIATMQRLAIAGKGLSGFISTSVRNGYSRKIR